MSLATGLIFVFVAFIGAIALAIALDVLVHGGIKR